MILLVMLLLLLLLLLLLPLLPLSDPPAQHSPLSTSNMHVHPPTDE